MNLLITLLCLMTALTGFAQQSLPKKATDRPASIDNMPVLKDNGQAQEMPTRNGQGTSIDIPTHVPAPTAFEIDIAMLPRRFDDFKIPKGFQTDSTDRTIPGENKRQKKDKKQ